MTNPRINEALYIAVCGGLCYWAAGAVKIDRNAALILGTAIGKILSVNTKNKLENYV